jgi:PAS domain S-box-containing protein
MDDPRTLTVLNETDQALLFRLMKLQRRSQDPGAMMAEAAEALARHLSANRAGFFRIAGDKVEFDLSWANGVLAPLRGQWLAADLGPRGLTELKAGRAFSVDNAAGAPGDAGSRFAGSGARAFVVLPVIISEGGLAGAYIHHASARTWTAPEIAFIREVAEITWDAVEQTRTVNALRESEQLFREIADVAPALIWMSDSTKACTWFNKPWLDFTGRSMEQELGDGWAQGVHPDDFDRCLATYSQAFDRRQTFRMDYRLKRYDGTYRIVDDFGVPRFSSSGTFLGYIGSCLDVTEHRAAERSLRESEARFRGVFEHAGTGIAIKDLKGRFQTCNPAYAAMLGYSAGELRGLPCKDLMHPDDRALNMVQQKRLLAGEISSFERLTRYFNKQGGLLWGRRHVSLLQDDASGPASIIVLLSDMTQQKRHEEQINLLMGEVNHRAKNMLTVVQSIARQTAAATPEAYIERFGERIQALAANQDLLVKNNWRGVDLGELACLQLGPFKDLIGTRIDLKGPKIIISASAAQAIGMALHELATNAGKYGALSNNAGRVEAKWSLDSTGAGEETFTMNWRETGGPPVTAPEKPGFGSAIISSVAEVSLGGKVELDFQVSGLSWRLRCPAKEVLDGSG